MPATTTYTSDFQGVPATWSFTTTAGQPATVEGPTDVTVQSGDTTASFVRSGDHAGSFMVSGLGDTVFLLSADADLGAGVVTIQDTVTVTVTSAQAASFGIQFGTPIPK